MVLVLGGSDHLCSYFAFRYLYIYYNSTQDDVPSMYVVKSIELDIFSGSNQNHTFSSGISFGEVGFRFLPLGPLLYRTSRPMRQAIGKRQVVEQNPCNS